MTNQKWIGFGKGTKNKKGEYIEMYFSPDDISSNSVEIKEGYEKVEVSDDVSPSSVPEACLLYTSPSPRDSLSSRMPSSA